MIELFLTNGLKSIKPTFRIGKTYSYRPLNLRFEICLIDKALIFGFGERLSFMKVFMVILAKF